MFKHLFGDTIKPACGYCLFADDAPEDGAIICTRKGRVSAGFYCRRFRYDPLRRIPKKAPRLPKLSPDEFKLE